MRLARLLEGVWSYTVNSRAPSQARLLLAPACDPVLAPLYEAMGVVQEGQLSSIQAAAAVSADADGPAVGSTSSLAPSADAAAASVTRPTPLPSALLQFAAVTDAPHVAAVLATGHELPMVPCPPTCLGDLLAGIRAMKYGSSASFADDVRAWVAVVGVAARSRHHAPSPAAHSSTAVGGAAVATNGDGSEGGGGGSSSAGFYAEPHPDFLTNDAIDALDAAAAAIEVKVSTASASAAPAAPAPAVTTDAAATAVATVAAAATAAAQQSTAGSLDDGRGSASDPAVAAADEESKPAALHGGDEGEGMGTAGAPIEKLGPALYSDGNNICVSGGGGEGAAGGESDNSLSDNDEGAGDGSSSGSTSGGGGGDSEDDDDGGSSQGGPPELHPHHHGHRHSQHPSHKLQHAFSEGASTAADRSHSGGHLMCVNTSLRELEGAGGNSTATRGSNFFPEPFHGASSSSSSSSSASLRASASSGGGSGYHGEYDALYIAAQNVAGIFLNALAGKKWGHLLREADAAVQGVASLGAGTGGGASSSLPLTSSGEPLGKWCPPPQVSIPYSAATGAAAAAATDVSSVPFSAGVNIEPAASATAEHRCRAALAAVAAVLLPPVTAAAATSASIESTAPPLPAETTSAPLAGTASPPSPLSSQQQQQLLLQRAVGRLHEARRGCLRPEQSLTHKGRYGFTPFTLAAACAALEDAAVTAKKGGRVALQESLARAVAVKRAPILVGFQEGSRRWSEAAGAVVDAEVAGREARTAGGERAGDRPSPVGGGEDGGSEQQPPRFSSTSGGGGDQTQGGRGRHGGGGRAASPPLLLLPAAVAASLLPADAAAVRGLETALTWLPPLVEAAAAPSSAVGSASASSQLDGGGESGEGPLPSLPVSAATMSARKSHKKGGGWVAVKQALSPSPSLNSSTNATATGQATATSTTSFRLISSVSPSVSAVPLEVGFAAWAVREVAPLLPVAAAAPPESLSLITGGDAATEVASAAPSAASMVASVGGDGSAPSASSEQQQQVDGASSPRRLFAAVVEWAKKELAAAPPPTQQKQQQRRQLSWAGDAMDVDATAAVATATLSALASPPFYLTSTGSSAGAGGACGFAAYNPHISAGLGGLRGGSGGGGGGGAGLLSAGEVINAAAAAAASAALAALGGSLWGNPAVSASAGGGSSGGSSSSTDPEGAREGTAQPAPSAFTVHGSSSYSAADDLFSFSPPNAASQDLTQSQSHPLLPSHTLAGARASASCSTATTSAATAPSAVDPWGSLLQLLLPYMSAAAAGAARRPGPTGTSLPPLLPPSQQSDTTTTDTSATGGPGGVISAGRAGGALVLMEEDAGGPAGKAVNGVEEPGAGNTSAAAPAAASSSTVSTLASLLSEALTPRLAPHLDPHSLAASLALPPSAPQASATTTSATPAQNPLMLALLLALGSHAAPSSSTTPTTAAGLARLTAAVGSLEARLTAAAQHSVGVAASVAAAAATSAASSALSSIVAQQTDAQTHQLAAAFAAGGRAAAAAAAASTSSYGASAGGGGGSGAFRPPDLPDGSYSSYSALLQQKQQQPQQYQPRSPSQQQQRPSGSQFAASAAPNFSGDNAAVSSSPGLPLSRGEVDAAAMLSELAPFDTDGGGGGERGAVVSTLGDFLPPSASAVAGLLHRASSSMRRALCELGELRAAWAASRRGMFSVPSGFAAERAAWVGGGARDDEDSSGDLDDVYDLDELEGGAGYASSGTLQFGGRHAGAAQRQRQQR